MATAVARRQQTLAEGELAAWRSLLRAHSSLVKSLDAELVEAHGLALSSYEVLARLAAAGEGRMRMCELAESVLLSRSGLTRLVDRLERGGLVARGSCEQDGRGAFAVITPAGLEQYEAARSTHLDGIRRHFAGRLSAAELATLSEHLRRLAGFGT
jgi:DNA-binding MarR family transcriptional regulator